MDDNVPIGDMNFYQEVVLLHLEIPISGFVSKQLKSWTEIDSSNGLLPNQKNLYLSFIYGKDGGHIEKWKHYKLDFSNPSKPNLDFIKIYSIIKGEVIEEKICDRSC